MAVTRLNGVVHANLDEPEYEDVPTFGGTWDGRGWEIDRSADGQRSIALFEQSGELDYEYPCDNVFVVRRGTMTITFADGRTLTFREGDLGFIPKGTKGRFTSDDFSDLVIFLSTDETPVDLI